MKTEMACVFTVKCPHLAQNLAYRWCSVRTCWMPAGIFILPMKKWKHGMIKKFARDSEKTSSWSEDQTRVWTNSSPHFPLTVMLRISPCLLCICETCFSSWLEAVTEKTAFHYLSSEPVPVILPLTVSHSGENQGWGSGQLGSSLVLH